MSKLFRFISLCSFLFAFSVFALAQSEEEMKVWQEYMTPGQMHQWMSSSTGDWTYTGTYWMTPDTEPVETSGTMQSEMLLDGRYMQQKHFGSMMGMPFEGINIVGYDNAKEKFVSTWMDNMGTGIMMAEGTYNETDRTIHFTGAYFDPMTKTDHHFRQVIRNIDENQQVMEMYMLEDGQEFKNMELTFVKSSAGK